MAICAKCGQEVPDGKYCTLCGARLGGTGNQATLNRCGRCGCENDPKARFCRECSANLAGVQRSIWLKGAVATVLLLAVVAIGFYASKHRPSAASGPSGNDGTPWVLVPAGEFTMGSSEGMGRADERPSHPVWVDTFYIYKFEVTFGQYDRFCDATGKEKPGDSDWGRGNRPVVNISWNDADEYCRWAGGRLPTEAEWEKACRAGTMTRWSWGDQEGAGARYAWYGNEATGKKTRPVGKGKPNPLGLYDMHGNALEWVADWYDAEYYASSPKRNPQGPDSGDDRSLRGGSWFNNLSDLGSATRHHYPPDDRYNSIGCRCAKNP